MKVVGTKVLCIIQCLDAVDRAQEGHLTCRRPAAAAPKGCWLPAVTWINLEK